MKHVEEISDDAIWVNDGVHTIPIGRDDISKFIKMLEYSLTSQLDVWRPDPGNCPDLVSIRNDQCHMDISPKIIPDIIRELKQLIQTSQGEEMQNNTEYDEDKIRAEKESGPWFTKFHGFYHHDPEANEERLEDARECYKDGEKYIEPGFFLSDAFKIILEAWKPCQETIRSTAPVPDYPDALYFDFWDYMFSGMEHEIVMFLVAKENNDWEYATEILNHIAWDMRKMALHFEEFIEGKKRSEKLRKEVLEYGT
jgi:hypothetical protein